MIRIILGLVGRGHSDRYLLYRVSIMSQRLITVAGVLVALVSLSLWAV